MLFSKCIVMRRDRCLLILNEELLEGSCVSNAKTFPAIHLRAASMKPKSLQNSVSKRGTVVESFFCQLSSQLGSHFWSLGLSIGARKTISKGSLGL